MKEQSQTPEPQDIIPVDIDHSEFRDSIKREEFDYIKRYQQEEMARLRARYQKSNKEIAMKVNMLQNHISNIITANIWLTWYNAGLIETQLPGTIHVMAEIARMKAEKTKYNTILKQESVLQEYEPPKERKLSKKI